MPCATWCWAGHGAGGADHRRGRPAGLGRRAGAGRGLRRRRGVCAVVHHHHQQAARRAVRGARPPRAAGRGDVGVPGRHRRALRGRHPGARHRGGGLTGQRTGWALAKAALAFVLVFFVGRRLLRPLFHRVAARRSAELFTLTVLFVSLAAGATTQVAGPVDGLRGLPGRHGAGRDRVPPPGRDHHPALPRRAAGPVLRRHRHADRPLALAQVWHWGLLGAAVLLVVKGCWWRRSCAARASTGSPPGAPGMLLAVGGEFGFALLALGLQAQLLDEAWARSSWPRCCSR
jgi:hypothetical protein